MLDDMIGIINRLEGMNGCLSPCVITVSQLGERVGYFINLDIPIYHSLTKVDGEEAWKDRSCYRFLLFLLPFGSIKELDGNIHSQSNERMEGGSQI